jgi:hypothetical protein
MILEITSLYFIHAKPKAQGYGMKFEFPGPQTPQQNGKAKWKFQSFFGRIRP